METKEVPIGKLKPFGKNPRRQFVCATCGIMFTTTKADKNRHPKFCSIPCYGKSLLGKPSKSNTKFKKGNVPWSLGLTKETDERLRINGINASKNLERNRKISQALKGKPLTEEHKKKLSKVKQGKPIQHFIENWAVICQKISLAEKGKPRPYQRGENHGNWEGGITPINAKIRNSFEFKVWREKVFERDDWTCQKCHIRGGSLHAHHIRTFSKYPELRLDVSNGLTLCEGCHDIIHHGNSEETPVRLEVVGV